MIRIFLQNRIWLIGFRVMVVISQNELKLLGIVEKWITLRSVFLVLMHLLASNFLLIVVFYICDTSSIEQKVSQ